MKKKHLEPVHPRRSSANMLLPAIMVIATGILVYARTVPYGFVFDDIENIVKNPAISDFRPSQLAHAFAQPWRALTLISFGLTRYLFGFNPAVFHLTNILIHSANALLVFGIAHLAAKRWLEPDKSKFFPLAAAMIFAVHPIQSEAVAYVWGRSSSLCALFYFAALLLMMIGLSKPDRRQILWFGLAVLAAYAAWKTKEEAITLPLAAAGLMALIGAWRAATCVAFLPVLYVAVRYQSLLQVRASVAENRELAVAGMRATLDPLMYFLTSLKGIVCYYLRLYIIPIGQSADAYLSPVTGFQDPYFWAAVTVLAALVALGFVMRSDRIFLLGLIMLFVSPLASYTIVPLPDIVAEHRVYISSLGFAILAAWLLTRIPHHRWAILAGIIIVLGVTALNRSGVWADNLTLWKDAEAKSPELERPHINLGMAYQVTGAENLAVIEYQHALALNPRLAPAYINLAGVFFNHGDLANSERLLLKAMEIAPALPEPYVNLAQIALKRELPRDALHILNSADTSATSHLIHIAKGDVYKQLGQYAEAAAEYDAAARLKPNLR